MPLIPDINRADLITVLRRVPTGLIHELNQVVWDPGALGIDHLVLGTWPQVDSEDRLCACPLVGVLLLRGKITPEALRSDPDKVSLEKLIQSQMRGQLFWEHLDDFVKSEDGDSLEGDKLRLALSGALTAVLLDRVPAADTEPVSTEPVDDAPPF